MPVMKAKTTTYEFDLNEIKGLIVSELCVPESAVTVEYVIQEVGGDPMDRYPGTKQVTKVRVTIDQTKV